MYALVLALGARAGLRRRALVPDAFGLGVVLGAGVDEPSSSIGRIRSWAVVLTWFTTCCDPAPGTVTVMSLAPCCCT